MGWLLLRLLPPSWVPCLSVALVLPLTCLSSIGLPAAVAAASEGSAPAPAGAPKVRLFANLTLTVVRAYATRSKGPNGAVVPPPPPDLYVHVTALSKRMDASEELVEFFFARTRVVRRSFAPVFNESFLYERDTRVPYTLGEDNAFRMHLLSASSGWTPDESLGSFLVDLGQEVLDREETALATDSTAVGQTVSPLERAGVMEQHGWHCVLNYKLDFALHPSGSRVHGAFRDEDWRASASA